MQDYTAAGLAAAYAQELRKSSTEYQEDVERIMRRMSSPHADALEVTSGVNAKNLAHFVRENKEEYANLLKQVVFSRA